tara:strand:+ start:21234 stop:21608 length:375 start_codon:yes stop_codon:yes gene_type:complete
MGFATMYEESEESLEKRYVFVFDTLNNYSDTDYVNFLENFNSIFNGDRNIEIVLTIDTRNIETIPFSILYHFASNLSELRTLAEKNLKKTILIVSSQIVMNAFKILFTLCSPISEIEYVFNDEQ